MIWCVDAFMHSSPFELIDPVNIKSELEEPDLKKSIKNRFQLAFVKGVLSLKPFAKLSNIKSPNPTPIPKTNLKPIELKSFAEVEAKEEPTESNSSEELDPVNAEIEALTTQIVATKRKQVRFQTKPKKGSKAEIGKAMYYCHVCNDHKKLSRNELKDHFLRHGMPEAVNSGSEFKRARAKQNRATRPSLHRCEVCSKGFPNQAELLDHLESHEDQFICDTCNAGFKTLIDHTCHVQEHSEDRLFRCPLCEMTTARRFQIRAHLYSQHEQFRKYKCDICNKGFSIYSYLVEHKNYHTGEKPFQCDVCGLSFMYTRYLNAHKALRHTEVDKKALECPICQKVCPNRKSYCSHVKSHGNGKSFVCDVCGKIFATSQAIATHRNIHSDSRPYKCKFCERGFKQASSRIDHERIHTGEKPHKCPHCGKGFTQRTSMVRHSRGHTGKRPYTCHLCKKGFVAKSVLVNHLKSSCEGRDDELLKSN